MSKFYDNQATYFQPRWRRAELVGIAVFYGFFVTLSVVSLLKD